jgi:hypothetical protein
VGRMIPPDGVHLRIDERSASSTLEHPTCESPSCGG